MEKYKPVGFSEAIRLDRYSIHPEESFDDACKRLARCISDAEVGIKREEYYKKFYEVLVTNRFSPGGRTWSGAGRPRGQLNNCFVCPAEDSREGWGELVKNIIIISGTGGGVGINFSKIRPRGAAIRGTGGEATGAVSLMKIINAACNELRAGGARRSALMFCLNWSHPDIPEFLECKLDKKELNNANISVCIDDQFLKLIENDDEVVFEWQGKEYGRIKAREMWKKIIENAWKSGDPGILNLGLANQQSNIYFLEDVVSTNPCGEIWLSPYDCCDLGAIVLPSHVGENGDIDWDKLDDTVRQAVRFLDNVLDVNEYPLSQIKDKCQRIRRIGLGVMGLHDMLLKMGVKYSSDEALTIADKVFNFIKKKAYDTSILLSAEKGSFQDLDREQFVKSGFCKQHLTPSLRRKIKEYGIRNCALLTVAPTGTTSIVASVSSGVEPMFAPIYKRNFNKHKDSHNDKKELSQEIVIHPLLKKFIEDGKKINHFEGSHDISPEHHLKMQAVCQKHVDNAISKTINLPSTFGVEQLSDMILSYIIDLKGVTIYRDGSKGKSPLMPLSVKDVKKYMQDIKVLKSVENDCPTGSCDI